MTQKTLFDRMIETPVTRRRVLAMLAGGACSAALPGCVSAPRTETATGVPALPSRFAPFSPVRADAGAGVTVPPGFAYHTVCSWGDALFDGDGPADFRAISAQEQERRIGFNNDFTAIFPLSSPSRALLAVNHEYPDAELMFPAARRKRDKAGCARTEMACVGITIAEIARNARGEWLIVQGSRYNRRITAANTEFYLTGPAGGSRRLRTKADRNGRKVTGTFGNCAGGKTPWGTYLSAEENVDDYFYLPRGAAGKEARKLRGFGISHKPRVDWHMYDKRFNAKEEPHEANRFGWVTETHPYRPDSVPVKRTALGRFKHEGATCALCKDGRVAVYMGDDEAFQHVYKFITDGKFDPENPKGNSKLLDSGTLYSARFSDNGTVLWMPLRFGEYGLDKRAGFSGQDDVLIDARRAARVLGATPMDRPEGIAVDPGTEDVYIALTNNIQRALPNPANPGSINIHGHIIRISPEGRDHAATAGGWDFALIGGAEESARAGAVPLSCPDNIAAEGPGHLWIGTDGMQKAAKARDGLYYLDVYNKQRTASRFLTAPEGAEVTGPSFSPDGRTLFVSIQHPGEKSGGFDNPSTRWPHGDASKPPLPSVIGVTRA